MKIIPVTNQGGVSYKVNFGNYEYSLALTFNYTAECWTMDILDATGALILAGIMLVPDVDLLEAYPGVKALIGTLILIEKNAGDYKLPDALGINVQLTWSAI
jgi:hypothetical protein